MIVTCEACQKEFDDAERDTGCPHPRFITCEDRHRKDLAFSLVNKNLNWKDEWANGRAGGALRIQSINQIGMVTLSGWTGEYDPFLLKPIEVQQ